MTTPADLPSAAAEARATFVELRESWYQTQTLGRAVGVDGIAGIDPPDAACGTHSECINRVTQMECTVQSCRLGTHCRNQRFQNREYAHIDVIQTELKGFGLRNESELQADDFIYEYVGEVIGEKTFARRIVDYANEGLQHFYFMMLQKETYIDATKKGGLGRFVNHSCNPNCYVAKWVVGKRMRMGIFAKRNIDVGEELTFNYNVDRYGHEPQTCYCGEANCVGFIGGKTQTDISGMDDLYLDALGIADDVKTLGLRGTKKVKNNDAEYQIKIKAVNEDEVPKVITGMRQSLSNDRILVRLLQRLAITEDVVTNRAMIRLRGLELLHTCLIEYPDNRDIGLQVLKVLIPWTSSLLQKNRIEDLKLPDIVRNYSNTGDAEIAHIASDLLLMWAGMVYGQRFPKRQQVDDANSGDVKKRKLTVIEERQRYSDSLVKTLPSANDVDFVRPVVLETDVRASSMVPEVNSPTISSSGLGPPPPVRIAQDAVSEVIRKAQEAAAAAANLKAIQDAEEEAAAARKAERRAQYKRNLAAAAEKERERAARQRKRIRESKSTESTSSLVSSADLGEKDKRLMKMVGELVVRFMSKYKEQLHHDTFKQHAKSLTTVIVGKEKATSKYTMTASLKAFSEEKQEKIKTYVKDYTKKLIENIKSHKKKKENSSNKSSHVAADDNVASTNVVVDMKDFGAETLDFETLEKIASHVNELESTTN